MKRLLSLRLFLFALLSTLVFSACDSGGSNGDSLNNEFSLDISPTAGTQVSMAKAGPDTTISGFSFFYSDTNPQGDEAFVIYFTGGKNFSQQSVQEGLFGFLGRKGLRSNIGTGSFQVVNTDQGFQSGNFIGILFEDYGSTSQTGGNPYYVPQSGTIDISKSTSNEVKGSVDLSAYRLTIDTSGVDSTQVDITGKFAAKNVGQYVPLATQ